MIKKTILIIFLSIIKYPAEKKVIQNTKLIILKNLYIKLFNAL